MPPLDQAVAGSRFRGIPRRAPAASIIARAPISQDGTAPVKCQNKAKGRNPEFTTFLA